jgi:hypothetical protein
MAAAIPLLAGAGAGFTASTVFGASLATSIGVGAVTAVAVNSMMNQPQPQAMAVPDVADVATVDTDTTVVDTSSATGGADTTINDAVSVQTDVASTADTSVDNTVYTADTSTGTAAAGAATAAAASSVSQGPAEDEAISFYERGRQSTILTTAQGLLSDSGAAVSMLRQKRSLTGTGLIA